MEPVWSVRLGVLIILFQVILRGYAESELEPEPEPELEPEPEPCYPGFGSELFRFRVHRKHLGRGAIIGTVIFRDCDERGRTLFDSTDKRFHVSTDGTIKIKRPVTLHDGHKMVTVHAWDSSGKKHTAYVRVEHDRKANHHHSVQKDTGATLLTQTESPSHVPVLDFPASGGLRRRKREWVIPPLQILENGRGPFPAQIAQIRSSHAKETKMVYAITGEGANEPPIGLFTINKDGYLFVSMPLDREAKPSYLLQATARSLTDNIFEPPMEIIVNVLDENDNRPVFTQNPFRGSVPEALKVGSEFMTVNATDADDSVNTVNAEIRYDIIRQTPELPQKDMFAINPVSGAIRVNVDGLDKEKYSEYSLEITATDREGTGSTTTGTAVITVTDSNDHAPQFEKTMYNVSVPENKVDTVVVRMPVTDKDEEQSPEWAAKFRIISGNNGGFFSIKTGPNKQEGIITTAKPLDYEVTSKYTLLVIAENEVPFAVPLITSTATVNVNVVDVNEAPEFDPAEKTVFVKEDVAVDSEITVFTAADPDTAKAQKVTYRVGNDPAGWLNVDQDTGVIRVKSPLDRESTVVYKATILAIDNDPSPATGTGTLIIELDDVNDNGPTIEKREFSVCNKEPEPVVLAVSDKDGPGFAAPYSVELQGDSKNNWTAVMNETKTAIILTLKTDRQPGTYNVVMKVVDRGLVPQVNTIKATVCACTGRDVQCIDTRGAGVALPGILGILGAILVLLLLVLLLLLLLRRKTKTKKEPLLNDDDIRDNIYYYDEEGGGEDDQDYDLSVLHRGLDNRPDVFRNDVAPTFMPAPQYRPRPANPEEIGTFIDDNLKAADNDPTAPPYDSLLVFDYEGGGSEAGSLSSLNSSSSGDQDYDCLHEWGPRFKKLADMYGGGED